jgi:predicted ABC-type exoprotein transport system permease subunit
MAMDYISASVVLFVSLCQLMLTDLVSGLLARLTFGTSIYLVFFPTILSGATALLVKYLVAMRVLPICKLLSGGLLALLVSWYIDRICKNNAFLLVRFVGLAIVFCAVLGVVIVSEEGFAERSRCTTALAVAASESVCVGD